MKFNFQIHYFTCDIDFESAQLSYGFSHPSTEVNTLSKCNENPSRALGDIQHARN